MTANKTANDNTRKLQPGSTSLLSRKNGLKYRMSFLQTM